MYQNIRTERLYGSSLNFSNNYSECIISVIPITDETGPGWIVNYGIFAPIRVDVPPVRIDLGTVSFFNSVEEAARLRSENVSLKTEIEFLKKVISENNLTSEIDKQYELAKIRLELIAAENGKK